MASQEKKEQPRQTSSPEQKTQPAPKAPTKVKRRDFLKLAAVGGIATAVAPYVPYGSFLSQGAGAGKMDRERIILSDGTTANINRFPVNASQIFVYPRTGDQTKDIEPFKRFQLIRLPSPEGNAKDASAFRAYSMICVHLWCLWRFVSERQQMECPCHGSIYRLKDGLAVEGPAAKQTPPNNALPMLGLEVDEKGDIWVRPPDLQSVEENGIIGYGRKIKQ